MSSGLQIINLNLVMLLDRKKYKLNTIGDNEFDVGYSGVVNAHR